MSDEDLIEEEQWRITDKGRRFLEEQRAAEQSKAQLIRLARFEAFTEVLEVIEDHGVPSTDLRRAIESLRGRPQLSRPPCLHCITLQGEIAQLRVQLGNEKDIVAQLRREKESPHK